MNVPSELRQTVDDMTTPLISVHRYDKRSIYTYIIQRQFSYRLKIQVLVVNVDFQEIMSEIITLNIYKGI